LILGKLVSQTNLTKVTIGIIMNRISIVKVAIVKSLGFYRLEVLVEIGICKERVTIVRYSVTESLRIVIKTLMRVVTFIIQLTHILRIHIKFIL
jgi:hypothetical protein